MALNPSILRNSSAIKASSFAFRSMDAQSLLQSFFVAILMDESIALPKSFMASKHFSVRPALALFLFLIRMMPPVLLLPDAERSSSHHSHKAVLLDPVSPSMVIIPRNTRKDKEDGPLRPLNSLNMSAANLSRKAVQELEVSTVPIGSPSAICVSSSTSFSRGSNALSCLMSPFGFKIADCNTRLSAADPSQPDNTYTNCPSREKTPRTLVVISPFLFRYLGWSSTGTLILMWVTSSAPRHPCKSKKKHNPNGFGLSSELAFQLLNEAFNELEVIQSREPIILVLDYDIQSRTSSPGIRA
ncbi:separase isoform X1 [Senna tora]|uniref:Separase isoform X1 n=1 Tax=Senna tora TaxID=362788 RepID=A0A834SRR7_9FABA|nr:separase isoform X1 [Senna tora]